MKTIYGTADIAAVLGVTSSAVSNWLIRYYDYPKAAFCTLDGRVYWDDLVSWVDWYEVNRPQKKELGCNV